MTTRFVPNDSRELLGMATALSHQAAVCTDAKKREEICAYAKEILEVGNHSNYGADPSWTQARGMLRIIRHFQ